MIKFSMRAVAAALVLATVSTPAAAYGWGHGWGYGHRGWGGPSWGSSYHEHHYYRGGSRRGSDSALVFGVGALLGAGVALAVSNNSRSSYSSSQITYVSPPVYAPAPVIYQQPVYVAPPVYQQPIYAAPAVSYIAPTVVYNPPVTYVSPPQCRSFNPRTWWCSRSSPCSVWQRPTISWLILQAGKTASPRRAIAKHAAAGQ